MVRVGIVRSSPLLDGGVRAALSGVEDWQLLPLDALPVRGEAEAVVLHTRDAADAQARLAALPQQLPAVLLGDGLQALPPRGAHEPRPLALLAPDATPPRLRAALAAVLEGLSVREPGADFGAATPRPADIDHEPLTPRELEVFELLGKGLSNRDIAGVLGISAHTAKFHVGQILAKVGAATRAEAVGWGLRLGLIGL